MDAALRTCVPGLWRPGRLPEVRELKHSKILPRAVFSYLLHTACDGIMSVCPGRRFTDWSSLSFLIS